MPAGYTQRARNLGDLTQDLKYILIWQETKKGDKEYASNNSYFLSCQVSCSTISPIFVFSTFLTFVHAQSAFSPFPPLSAIVTPFLSRNPIHHCL